VAGLEVAQDRERVGHDLPVVEQHGHQGLAAGTHDRGAIGGVDDHELGVEALVAERQPHALDVGGEGGGEELHGPTVRRRSVKRKRLLLQ
jgi:hypothetical protein